MKTTLNLNDDLAKAARQYAAARGGTLTRLVEEGLREVLRNAKPPAPRQRLTWVVTEGGPQPGVDLADRDALYDRMEGRS